MTTLIKPLCHQKHRNKVSNKEMSSFHWESPRCTYEMPSLTLPILSPTGGNEIDMVMSKTYQSNLESCNDTTKSKKYIHKSVLQSSSKNLGGNYEVKQKKRRSNRDSLFSFMSIIIKNDNGRPVEGRLTKTKEDVSSPVYSQISFLSSSSTIDIPSQIQSVKVNTPSNVLAPARVSMAHSRSSDPSPITKSASFKCNDCKEDSPKCTSLQIRSDNCQRDSDEDAHKARCSPQELDKDHLNFFQEQQEQEYRIAKAWLEAEESRKKSPATSRGGARSRSSESHWDDAWIGLSNLENGQQVNKTTTKNNLQNRDGSNCHLNSKVILDKLDVNVQLDGNDSAVECSETLSGEYEDNTKRKRISGVVSLAIGVRGWLSRRGARSS